LKAREAPLKKRKRSETARPQFQFWIKIRVNPIYLVIFFMVATPNPSLSHTIFSTIATFSTSPHSTNKMGPQHP
jgi:hypothetical protein